MFQVRKDGFKDNPSVAEELDLVEEDDQFTHMITLDDATSGEEILNVFKVKKHMVLGVSVFDVMGFWIKVFYFSVS